LPGDWVIFAGRKLAGANRDDVDLIVVGKATVFVLEEKAWGPRIVVDDNNWYVGDDRRQNPLNRVAQVARKVAGLFREHVKGYENVRGRRVVSGVVLSHDRLTLVRGTHHDESENVLALSEAADHLERIDQGWESNIAGVRHRILAYLDDLPDRAVRHRIGGYEIDGQLDVPGLEQAYAARSADGQSVILKCYPIGQLRALGDPSEFLKRESLALNKLADAGRTWRSFPPFESDEHDLYVVPVVPPSTGKSLEDYTRSPGPERPGDVLDDQVARDVAIDAFTALSEVHEYGLVHRALHPRRIWLGRRMRVMFSDFHLARVPDAGTIHMWARDYDISEDYRAPECAADVALATSSSDVFSLTLCLASWLLRIDPTERTIDELGESLHAAFPWSDAMLGCLDGSPTQRPSAEDVVAGLTPHEEVTAQEDGPFQVGGVIAGRYEVIRQLGRGGFATSWLVHDRQAEQTKVLKEFHQGVPEELRAEYRAADRLHHDRCGRVYDVQVESDRPYLLSEYVEGESLDTRGIDRTVDELRSIADGVLEALAYIHGKDFVHGDVTPANVIVSTDGSGEAKLIDFGLAVKQGARPIGMAPKFAAPEILSGQPATQGTDLFGFAATMAYAMLGRVATRVEGNEVVLARPTEPELESWGDEGSLLLRAIMRGVATRPSDRPATATAFAELLRSARPAPPAPPAPSTEQLQPRINENVTAIRRLYRGSSTGNAGNRGLDDEFAIRTYVPTLLDEELLPRILDGEFDLVLLSGNPGDGKTSVLVKLGEALRDRGAVEESSDEAGWRLRLDGRRFLAVFDASESHGAMTSDELVSNALAPVVADEPATALIAVNDGRLLQFFADHEGDYEELWFAIQDQLEGKPSSDERVVLVDLKRRSLAAMQGTAGLANRALAALTDESLWRVCSGCSSQAGCPILANRNVLAAEGGETFSELMLISHLRRRRRATFRDVRSAAAWLITGDRSCSDIHTHEDQGQSPMLVPNALVRDLTFSIHSNDYLIDEWSTLDPGLVAAPTVDSLRRRLQSQDGSPLTSSVSAIARALYVRELKEASVTPDDIRSYRYLDEFRAMLSEERPKRTRDRVLLGISRLVGAFGFDSPGLAVSSGMKDATWAVLHTTPADDFEVTLSVRSDPYIEVIPDQVGLKHRTGPTLSLTLDTAEIILRAADGEVVNDPASDAVRQEIDSFVGQLSRQPSASARIVDTSGSVAIATVEGPELVLELP
jgi:serine/threonine protein kinase